MVTAGRSQSLDIGHARAMPVGRLVSRVPARRWHARIAERDTELAVRHSEGSIYRYGFTKQRGGFHVVAFDIERAHAVGILPQRVERCRGYPLERGIRANPLERLAYLLAEISRKLVECPEKLAR